MDPHLAQDEDLQKLKDWWSKNGSSIIVGIAAGLAAIVGVNGWNWYTANRAETASALYYQVRQSVAEQNPDKARELTRELRGDFAATPYAASAALLAAGATYETGDGEGAREMLQWALANAPDVNFEHTARIRLAYLELWEGNEERAIELATVDDPGRYVSHYAEIRAEAQRAAGRSNEALAAYDEAIAALSPGSSYAGVLAAKRNSLARAE